MLGGWDDFLTVQPKSDIKDPDLFKTPEGCEDAIYGAYSNLGTDEVYGRMMRYYLPEALAQSYNGSNLASALTDMMDYNHDLSDPKEVYATAWAGMYTAIGSRLLFGRSVGNEGIHAFRPGTVVCSQLHFKA